MNPDLISQRLVQLMFAGGIVAACLMGKPDTALVLGLIYFLVFD